MQKNTKITIDMIKELRDRTGAGFLECQQALKAADGDLEVAIDAMRKAGQAKAAKKTGRIAVEGAIAISVSTDGKSAFMVEVNSETDFVARDENFKNFVQKIVVLGLIANVDTLKKLLTSPIQAGESKTVEQDRENLVAKLGENIQVRRIFFMRSVNVIYHYLHRDRIGVLIELSLPNKELGKDIAMHIAASRPDFIRVKDIPETWLVHEKEVYLAQALASGKPQAIAEKMVEGRLSKHIDEITLLGQPFVKDPSLTIAELLKKANNEVLSFKRFELGEGLEKKSSDFATEVAAQMNKV